jgi:hypothetical protein
MKILILILAILILKANSLTKIHEIRDPALVRIIGGDFQDLFMSCDLDTRKCIGTRNSEKGTYFYKISMANENYELQVNNDLGLCLFSFTSTLEVKLNPCDASYTSKWRNGGYNWYGEKDSPIENLDGRKLWWGGEDVRIILTNSWFCAFWKCGTWRLLGNVVTRRTVYNPNELVKINGGGKYDLWLSCNASSRHCIGTRDGSKATIFYKIASPPRNFQLKLTDHIGLCVTAKFKSHVYLWPCLYRNEDLWNQYLTTSNGLQLKWDDDGKQLLLGDIACQILFWKCDWRIVNLK